MTYSSNNHIKTPTKPQLDLIPKLCEERGVSFDGPPKTAGQADERIKALLAMSRLRGERIEDAEAVADAFAGWGGASAVRDDEIIGYGATARWA